MKKLIGGIITIIGAMLAVWGWITKAKGATSIVIGGADGPTSVFIAGKVGNGLGLSIIFAAVILVVAGIVILIKPKKR